MKLRHLEKRLRRVESILPPLPDASVCWAFGVQWFGIAYYLGKPAAGEEPFVAFARALGYADELELKTAMTNDVFILPRRFSSAERKLRETFGISLKSDDPKNALKSGDPKNALDLLAGLERMEAGLPKSYKNRLKKIVTRADINIAWICLHDGLVAYLRCFA